MATGTRELEALSPLHVAPRADALLLTGGSAFGLAAATGVNRTTVSHQLRTLRVGGVVARRRAGKVVFYSLADDHVRALLAMGTAHAAHTGADADPG